MYPETIPQHNPTADCRFLLTEVGCPYCCDECNYATHNCTGCGAHIGHLKTVCGECDGKGDW